MSNIIHKLGSILQSRKATPEEVKKAYNSAFDGKGLSEDCLKELCEKEG